MVKQQAQSINDAVGYFFLRDVTNNEICTSRANQTKKNLYMQEMGKATVWLLRRGGMSGYIFIPRGESCALSGRQATMEANQQSAAGKTHFFPLP